MIWKLMTGLDICLRASSATVRSLPAQRLETQKTQRQISTPKAFLYFSAEAVLLKQAGGYNVTQEAAGKA